jgi:hypothetical protein
MFLGSLSIPAAFTRHISGIEVIAVRVLVGLLHVWILSLATGSPLEGAIISNRPTMVVFLRFLPLVNRDAFSVEVLLASAHAFGSGLN